MILVDAHVHLHECFPPARFLDAAARNIARCARRMGLAWSTPGMLLFTQCAADDAFGGLRPGCVGQWSVTATSEANAIRALHPAAPSLTLVAGRQIATAEGLEVLALGAGGPFADGQSTPFTIDAVVAQGGVPTIPWGFGKWWRRRGALVRRVIADRHRFPLLFLGDSAGRLGITPRPRLFGAAERQSRAILPGTDPLPFAREIDKVGRLVFPMDVEITAETPFADLKRWLSHCDASPAAVGTYERPLTFMARQIAMQLRKRRHARA